MGGADREALVLSAKAQAKDCKKKLHSLKVCSAFFPLPSAHNTTQQVEIRGLEQTDKGHYEEKLSDKKSRLLQLQKQLKEKEDEGVNAVFFSTAAAGGGEDGRKEVRALCGKIDRHQEESQAALERMQCIIRETGDIAADAVDALTRSELRYIEGAVDDLQADVHRAKGELNTFSRRMATDKLILCCLFLLILGVVVAIILKFALPKTAENNTVLFTPAP